MSCTLISYPSQYSVPGYTPPQYSVPTYTPPQYASQYPVPTYTPPQYASQYPVPTYTPPQYAFQYSAPISPSSVFSPPNPPIPNGSVSYLRLANGSLLKVTLPPSTAPAVVKDRLLKKAQLDQVKRDNQRLIQERQTAESRAYVFQTYAIESCGRLRVVQHKLYIANQEMASMQKTMESMKKTIKIKDNELLGAQQRITRMKEMLDALRKSPTVT